MKQKQRKDANTGMYFKIPNTPEGNEFLYQLHAYKTMGTRITIRGRGARTKHAVADGKRPRNYDQDLPLRHAEWFAVYVHRTLFEEFTKKDAMDYRAAYNNAVTLSYKLAAERDEAVRKRDEALRKLSNVKIVKVARRAISLADRLN
jgi:hypothetical protein